jgi:hypothetical protein
MAVGGLIVRPVPGITLAGTGRTWSAPWTGFKERTSAGLTRTTST